MTSNVLAFALGLETNLFTRGIQHAEQKTRSLIGSLTSLAGPTAAIAGVVGAFTSLRSVAEGVMGAIEHGAGLAKLSAITGELPSELYKVQQGFKSVGADADSLQLMLLRLQKGIGGLAKDKGGGVVAQLGLDKATLAAAPFSQQIAMLAGSIGKLNQPAAVAAVSNLFGGMRQGGGGVTSQMLLIARNADEFKKALAGAAQAGDIFGRNAERFHQFEIQLTLLKNKAQGFFVSLAAAALPGLRKIVDAFNGIDFVGIGAKFGDMLTRLASIIETHNLGELLRLSLSSGIESFHEYFVRTLSGAAAMAGQMFENITTAHDLERRYESLTPEQRGTLGHWEGRYAGAERALRARFALERVSYAAVGGLVGKSEFTPSAQLQADRERRNAIKDTLDRLKIAYGVAEKPFMELLTSGIGDAFAKAFKESGGMAHGARDAFKKFWDTFVQEPEAEKARPRGAGESLAPTYHTQATALEKLGFMFGGLTHTDHAAATAHNTRRILDENRAHYAWMRARAGSNPYSSEPSALRNFSIE